MRWQAMRAAGLASIIVVGACATSLAAQPSWLGDLFGARHVVHQRHRAAPKPASKPATRAPAPTGPAAAERKTSSNPPVPLPESRPAEAPVNAPPPVPAPAPSANPDTATTLPATSQTSVSPARQQNSAPAPSPAAVEGERSTPQPPRIYQTACPAVITGLVAAKPLPPISEGQCQDQSPLSVTEIQVNGRMVPLSTPAEIDCQMASDLPGWVAEVDNFAETLLKTRIASVTVGGSFECRPRNTPDKADTNISEHGRADAVDVVGFGLADGRRLTVGSDYASADAPTARFMHFAHDAACTRFTTVLGPDANGLHHEHFHLDLGCHGQSCTYRLCE
jgi:hypothetical protein